MPSTWRQAVERHHRRAAGRSRRRRRERAGLRQQLERGPVSANGVGARRRAAPRPRQVDRLQHRDARERGEATARSPRTLVVGGKAAVVPHAIHLHRQQRIHRPRVPTWRTIEAGRRAAVDFLAPESGRFEILSLPVRALTKRFGSAALVRFVPSRHRHRGGSAAARQRRDRWRNGADDITTRATACALAHSDVIVRTRGVSRRCASSFICPIFISDASIRQPSSRSPRRSTEPRPHLLAVSGDLTQRARRREFAAAERFSIALPFPRLVVPGNHDVPLHNVFTRFLTPLARYRHAITDDLSPVSIATKR